MTKYLPSGLTSIELTSELCPMIVFKGFPDIASIKRILPGMGSPVPHPLHPTMSVSKSGLKQILAGAYLFRLQLMEVDKSNE
ncbi:hypothetical protein [[Eubacterium] cellulosolvens]